MKQQGNLQTIQDTRQNQTDATTKLNEKKKKKKKKEGISTKLLKEKLQQ